MSLIKRFTPGGNIYPDGSSTFAMLREFFQAWAENRDTMDTAITQSAAVVAAEQVRPDILQEANDPDSIFAVTDEDGRKTWLDVSRDGGPTAYAAEKIAPTVAPAVAAEVGIDDMNSDINELSVAIVDEDDRRTWLEADMDGGPSPRAVELLRTALDTGPAPAPLVVCSGDSMTGGAFGSPYPAHLASITGWTVINDGVGGETSTTIAGRMGGRPMMVTPAGGSIPASGPVTVALDSDDKVDPRGVVPLMSSAGGVNPVRVAGIEGTLAVVNKDDPATRYYTFTRATSGTAVPVNYPQPLITYAMREHRTGVHVMWWGTNDVGAYPDVFTHIIARQRALIEHLTEPKPRYLVLGMTVSTAAGRAPWNDLFRREFGRRFLDIGAYLSSPAALQDAGITATSEDTNAMAEGRISPSLTGDGLHLTDAGNQLVARQVRNRIQEMGWL